MSNLPPITENLICQMWLTFELSSVMQNINFCLCHLLTCTWMCIVKIRPCSHSLFFDVFIISTYVLFFHFFILVLWFLFGCFFTHFFINKSTRKIDIWFSFKLRLTMSQFKLFCISYGLRDPNGESRIRFTLYNWIKHFKTYKNLLNVLIRTKAN